MTIKTRLALVLLLVATAGAHAAGLGKLTVNSALGQNLDVEIDLVSVQAGELDTLSARVASPEAYRDARIEYSPALRMMRFAIDKRANGQAFIKITSIAPINEPFVDVLVEMTWPAGRIQREYPILLDPPNFQARTAPRAAAPPPAASVAAPPPASTPAASPSAPAPAAVAPSARPSAPAASAPAATGTPGSRTELASTPPRQAGDTYGPVERGDTLRKIADEVKPDGVSLEQMLVALYRQNQSAFVDNNMNRLKAGQILRVPSLEEASKASAREANTEYKSHVANWNQYRGNVASNVGSLPPRAESSSSATGRVASSAVPPPAPPVADSKDTLKLSKSDAGKSGAAAGKGTGANTDRVNALQEEVIAKDKALKESQSRVAELEKQVRDMQRLVDLKAGTAAKVDPKAPVVAAAPTPAPAKPADTKVAEAPKPVPVPAPTPAPATPAATPTPSPALPQGGGSTAAKPGEPAKLDAAKPADTKLADASKPTDPSKPADPAKPADTKAADAAKAPAKPADAKPADPKGATKKAPPPPPEEGLTDNLPLMLAVGGGALALGAVAFFFMRRRRRSDAGPSSSMTSAFPSDLKSTTGQGGKAGGLVDTGNSSFLTDFDKTGPGTIDTDEVDPVAEAEVYIAYGRDAQAEEILREAMARDKGRHEIPLKLLEIYHARKSATAFETVAKELHASVGDGSPIWAKAAAMGAQIDPTNPLYAAAAAGTGQFAATSAFQAEAPKAAPPDLDFDLAGSSGQTAAGSSTAPDFDLDLDSHKATPDLATDSSHSLDMDIGGSSPAPAAAEVKEEKPSFDFDLSGLDFPSSSTPDSTIAPASSNNEFADLTLDEPGTGSTDAVGTKLELAKAYLEIGDKDGAREILEEVVKEGSSAQKSEAQGLIGSL